MSYKLCLEFWVFIVASDMEVTRAERTRGVLVLLVSIFSGGIVEGLVFAFAKSPFVREIARRNLNFHLSAQMIAALPLSLMVFTGLATHNLVIFVIIASALAAIARASQGKYLSYPLSLNFVKPGSYRA